MLIDAVLFISGITILALIVLWLMGAPTRRRRGVITSAGLNSLSLIGRTVSLFDSLSELSAIENAPTRIIQLSKSGNKNWVWGLFHCQLHGAEVYLFENKLTGFYKVFFTQSVVVFELENEVTDFGIFSKQYASKFPGETDDRIGALETRSYRYEIDDFNVISSETILEDNLTKIENILKLGKMHWNAEFSGKWVLCYRLNQFIPEDNLKEELERMLSILRNISREIRAK